MNNPFLRDLCAALVLSFGHFLWIGTLIAVVAAVFVRRQTTAAARYGVWLVGLIAMAVSPFVTLAVLMAMPPAVTSVNGVPVSAPSALVGEPVGGVGHGVAVNDASRMDALVRPLLNDNQVNDGKQPNDVSEDGRTRASILQGDRAASGSDEQRSAKTNAIQREPVWWREYAPVVASLYLIGVALMGLRLAFGLWGGRRLRNQATLITERSLLDALQRQADALGLKLVPALAYCERVAVPTVLGILKPMILLPVSLASGLAPDQIESVLAHELAHLRRYDHLVNLMQCVIESVLFFHPTVWWVSRRVRDEREHCCDDLVVACGAVPLDYAASLLRVAELSREAEQRGHSHQKSFTAVSLFATGDRPSTLRQRIARLLGYQTELNVRAVHPWVLFCLATCCVGAIWLLSSMTMVVIAEINRDRSQKTVIVTWSAIVDDSVMNEIRAINGLTTFETGAMQTPADGKFSTLSCSAEELRAILKNHADNKRLVTLQKNIRHSMPTGGWRIGGDKRFFQMLDTEVIAATVIQDPGYFVNWYADGHETRDEDSDRARLIVDGKFNFTQSGFFSAAEAKDIEKINGIPHLKMGNADSKKTAKFDAVMTDGEATLVVLSPPAVTRQYQELLGVGKDVHWEAGTKQAPQLHAIFVHEAVRIPVKQLNQFHKLTRVEDWVRQGATKTKEHVARIAEWQSRPSHSAFDADATWTRELPHGGHVQLVGLGRPGQAKMIWWTPAGEPLTKTHTNFDAPWSNSETDLAAIVRIWESGGSRNRLKPISSWGQFGITNVDDQYPLATGSQLLLVPVLIDKSTGKATLKIGAGFGNWTDQTPIQMDLDFHDNRQSTATINGIEFKTSISHENNLIDHSAPISSPQFKLTVNKKTNTGFFWTPTPELEFTVDAESLNGRTVPSHTNPIVYIDEPPNTSNQGITFEHPLAKSDIKQFLIKSRPVHWTEFTGFAIEPAVALVPPLEFTKVQVAQISGASESNNDTTGNEKQPLIELRNQIAARLPTGWKAEIRNGSIAFMPSDRKADPHWLQWPESTLWFDTQDTASDIAPVEGASRVVSLGLCRLGYASLRLSPKLSAAWPDCQKQIRELLPTPDETARSEEPSKESWTVVEGTLRYEDGSPVKGAMVRSEGKYNLPVGDDGSFQTKLEPNWSRIFISLKGATDWPAAGSLPRAPAYVYEILDVDIGNSPEARVRRDITLHRTKLRTVKLLWNGPTTSARVSLRPNLPKEWLATEANVRQDPSGDDNPPDPLDDESRVGKSPQRPWLSATQTLDVTLELGKQLVLKAVPPGDGSIGIEVVPTRQQLAWELTGDDEDERLVYDPANLGGLEFKMLGDDGQPLKQPAAVMVSRLMPNLVRGIFMSAVTDQSDLNRPVFDAKTQSHRISNLQPGKYQAALTLDSMFGAPVVFEIERDKITSIVLATSQQPVAAVPFIEPNSYIANLPDGRSVELVGITKNTAPANEGWKPDGTPIGDVGYWPATIYRSGNTTGAFTENGKHPEPNVGAIDLLFRFRGLKAQPSLTFDLAANGGSYSHWPVKDPYELRVSAEKRKPLPGHTWSIPDGEMRVGLTDEPWGKWLQVSPDGKVLNPLTDEDHYRSCYEQVHIVKVEPHDRAPNKRALVLHQPKKASSLYAFEIRGIDEDGKSQWVSEWESRSVERTEREEGRWGLASTEKKPLARYEFRLRPYRHFVTFTGVSLEQGKTSDVKVKAKVVQRSEADERLLAKLIEEQQRTVVGTVVSPDGKPVAGIEVLAFQGEEQLEQQFKTDERGEIRVPKEWRETEHWLTLVARDGRDRLGWFDFMIHGHSDIGQKAEDGSFKLVLLPMSRTVRGRVVDEAGMPLAQVPVRINQLSHDVNQMSVHWRYQSLGGEPLVRGGLTDNEGRFEVKVPTDSTIWLGAKHPDWVEKTIIFQKENDDAGETKLVRAAKVSGRVTDARNGKPLAGVFIAAQATKSEIGESSGDEAKTDADGNYLISGLRAGEYTIQLERSLFKTLTAAAQTGVELKAGETHPADFALNVGQRLTGRVLHLDTGEPIPRCKVNCTNPAQPISGLSTETDEKGEFEFLVPPGKSNVSATQGRQFGNDSEREVDVPTEGDVVPITLKVGDETERVPGSFKISVGKPLERKVRLDFKDEPFAEALKQLCDSAIVTLELDEAALKEAGYSKDTPVTLIDENPVTLGEALTRFLKPFDKLTYRVEQNRIVIVTSNEENTRDK